MKKHKVVLDALRAAEMEARAEAERLLSAHHASAVHNGSDLHAAQLLRNAAERLEIAFRLKKVRDKAEKALESAARGPVHAWEVPTNG